MEGVFCSDGWLNGSQMPPFFPNPNQPFSNWQVAGQAFASWRTRHLNYSETARIELFICSQHCISAILRKSCYFSVIFRLEKASQKTGGNVEIHFSNPPISIAMPVELLPENDGQKISIPSALGHVVEPLNDVVRFEADSNYSKVLFKNRSPLFVARTLGAFQKLLPGEQFHRVHHGHLIHKLHIESVDKQEGTVKMTDGVSVPISRRKSAGFFDFLKKK